VGRTSVVEQKNYAQNSHFQALLTLAEELKLPLVQIARLSESTRAEYRPESVEAIELTAQSALTLVDGLLLSLRLYTTDEPQLQPIALGAVLQDTAHSLSAYAQQRDCRLQLHVGARSSLVIADPVILQAALASLGLMFIEASSQQQKPPVVTLAAHRSRWGMVTGLYSQQPGLSTDLYRRAHQLFGRATRPLSQFVAGNGAGAVIADALLHTMSSQLHISHHQKQPGLAATLLPSQQLHLV
jgi:C4-dicarboxylate-specific signal transduction histidine kinase